MSILLTATIQHPRKWGCKLYALILLSISSVGLLISAAHSSFQQMPSGLGEACTGSSFMAIQALSYIDKALYLLQNKLSCVEAPLLYGIGTAHFITLIALCLFLFSLYLLFRRVERNIFS
jgi:disulfide bond formation protein DsbB